MRKIVCLGDSITYGYDSSSKMKSYKQVNIPYPTQLNNNLSNEFIVYNSGNVGWQARQTVKHLDELVFKYEPELCVLMLGINDSRGSRQGLMVSKKNYLKNMQAIISQLQARNIKVLVLSPTPVIFKRAKKFYKYSRQIAMENKLPYLDVYKLIIDDLEKNDQSLKDILKDNVHLSQEYYIKLGDWVYEYLQKESLI